MEKIASFTIDHNKLLSGIYVSRKDTWGDTIVTTFDLRFLPPNRAEVFSTGVMHTVEHIAATYLRNSAMADRVVYFGPMGCRTGFYLICFGDISAQEIAPVVKQVFEYTANFSGDIPGATPSECGNYSDQDLEGAKKACRKYLEELDKGRYEYPAVE